MWVNILKNTLDVVDTKIQGKKYTVQFFLKYDYIKG